MAAIDYWLIRQRIRDALVADVEIAALPAFNIRIEPDIMPSMELSPFIGIYMESRSAPAGNQRLSAARQVDYTISASVWITAFALSLEASMQLRDRWIGVAELALLRDPTLGDTVKRSLPVGGLLLDSRTGASYAASGEIGLSIEAAFTI